MGRRRRWKSKGLPAPGPATHDADPVTRSISICEDRIAIASGRRWRVVDIKNRGALHTDASHEGSIRGIQFSPDGQYLLTCADDKTARSWSTNDWSCLRILKAAKKATACAFSSDGKYLFFSDRFGDVLTATTLPPTAAAAEGVDGEPSAAAAAVGADANIPPPPPATAAAAAAGPDADRPAAAAAAAGRDADHPAEAAAAAAADRSPAEAAAAAEAEPGPSTPTADAALAEGPAAAAAAASDSPAAAAAASDEPSLLLGHLQAIISSLITCNSSSGQPLLISTDRDGKVRASVLPKDPMKGSYEIQSYCLGHTNFVTCAAAVPQAAAYDHQQQQQQQQLIVSGGGDGTIRLWDVDTGKQLAVYVASKQPPPVPIQQQQQQQQNGNEQQQENGEQHQQQQDEDDGSGSSSSSDEDECDGAVMGEAAATGAAPIDEQATEGNNKLSRSPIQRKKYAAVLNLAVSPDGKTLAAAVEGQQEIQILKITQNDMLQGGSNYAIDLQQKLQFSDVCNPAAVAFDDQGRLWVVGGVLKLESESAHVAIAAQCEPGADYTDITSKVLPDDLRSYLECRVDQEESAQASSGHQIGYYHEGFKRKVYQRGEDDPKRPRTHLKEAERLKVMRETEDRKRQQQQSQSQQVD